MKKIVFILGAVIIALLVIFFFVDKKEVAQETDIVATFYPLAEFAKNVAGDKMTVLNITPAGVEPHDYEPTPQEIRKIYSAKLFIYNGAGFDPFAEKIAPELEVRGIITINMADFFELLELEEDDEFHEEDEEEHLQDPHFWLDPTIASRQVEIIKNAIAQIDPQNSNFYDANAKEYQEKLLALDQKYQEGLSLCEKNDVVASHAAFGYLAKRYNLNVISIAGLSPEQEPSPRRLAEIAELAKEKDIRYIFFEELSSPAFSQTIANEIGAQTLVFNPIEGLSREQEAMGENYISIMEKNLENLKIALACQ